MENRPHEYKETESRGCAVCGIGVGALVHNTGEIEAYNKVPDADTKDVSRCGVCGKFFEVKNDDWATCSEKCHDEYCAKVYDIASEASKSKWKGKKS